MNQRFLRELYTFLAAPLLAIGVAGCLPSTKLRYQDDLVEISEHSRTNLLNVHASSDTETLKIWGRSYSDVRGRNSCYLKIPGRQMIIFVTGKTWDNGQATVHLADLDTKKIRSFPAYDSNIGANIGDSKSDQFEKVFSADGDTIIIQAGFLDRRYQYLIDVRQPRFVREEGSFDSTISKTREHYVYEAGKKPVRH